MKHFCFMSGTLFVFQVNVQTEKVLQICINVY